MQDFRKLRVWEAAHQLTLDVYRVTDAFPAREQFGLCAQMRRSAASIPTNIAEGCGRETTAELIRYLYHALGSASELDYQLLLSRDLSYIDEPVYENLAASILEVKRMLGAFIARLKVPGSLSSTEN